MNANTDVNPGSQVLKSTSPKAIAPFPAVIYESEFAAQRFVDYLRKEAGLNTQSTKIKNADKKWVWEISAPADQSFALEVLQRFHKKGLKIKEIPIQSTMFRSRMLKDVLIARASVTKEWAGPSEMEKELAWYQTLAKLNPNQIRQAVEQARTEFMARRSQPHNRMIWIGGLFCLLGGLSGMLWGFATPWPLLLLAGGTACLGYGGSQHYYARRHGSS